MRILNRKNVRKSPSERTWRDVVVGGGFQIEESTKMSQSRSKWNIKRLEKIGQNKRERVQFINYSSLRTMSKVSWYSSVLYLSYCMHIYITYLALSCKSLSSLKKGPWLCVSDKLC